MQRVCQAAQETNHLCRSWHTSYHSPAKENEMEVETTKYSNDVYITDTEYSTRLWQAKHDKSRLSSKSPIESQ